MKLFERIPEEGWLLLPAGEPTLDAPAQRIKCPIHRVGEQAPGALAPARFRSVTKANCWS